jgi:hypothetical protein
MLRHVVRTEVPEEPSASIIKVTRIAELGTAVAVTSNKFTDSCFPDDGGYKFLRIVISYESHTA